MNLASLNSQSDITCQIAKYCLGKYQHLLKWRDYKENVLDVGCGSGSVVKTILYPCLEKKIQKLLAVDKDESMIEHARKNNHLDKIEYRTLDIMDDDGTNAMRNTFDHIFSSMVVHWIVDTKKLLTVFSKMLKPKGQVYFAALTDNIFQRSVSKQLKDGKWSQYIPSQPIFAEYTDNPTRYFRDLLESMDFRVDLCVYEEVLFSMKNFTELVKAVAYMMGLLNHIPVELRQDYVRDYVINCKEQCTYSGEPDKYSTTYQLLICIASKRE